MTIPTIPDSDLAKRAKALAAEVEPAFLIHHSERTFLLGAQLLTSNGRTFDSEILYVASMLHDLALGTELDDGTTPFHIRGGGIAASYLLEAGRTDHEASLVFSAIAMHMQLTTADDARPEVAGVHLGAAADVVGLRVDQISQEWLEAMIAQCPRVGMKKAFAEVIAAEAKKKPYSEAAALIRDFNFLDLILAAPFDE